jgi:thioredoxin reductase
LGPDWAQDLRLEGLSERKNVRILYKTECRRLLDRPHLHSPEPNIAHLWPVYASLSSGELVGVDVVVSATGVKPNVPSWLLGGKVELDEESGGILVDERMETSAVGVYAAGDVGSPRWGKGGSNKHWMQIRLWTQARQFGLYAGKAMYAISPLVNSDLPLATSDLSYLLRIFLERGEYIKCVLQDGRLQ